MATEKISELDADVGIKAGFSLHLWNGPIDPVNYERGYMRWVGNVLEFGAEAAGTGVLRKIRFGDTVGTWAEISKSGVFGGGFGTEANPRGQLDLTVGVELVPWANLPFVRIRASSLATGFEVMGATNTKKTYYYRAAQKDTSGAYTGDGHDVIFKAGDGSSQTTGGAGGTTTLAGADAKGTGNNNGGDAIMQGGLPTGTGLPGVSKVDYMKPKTLPLVADLRPASAALEGAKAHVTDATTRVFGDIVVGGGALSVPVHCDGTAWRIG